MFATSDAAQAPASQLFWGNFLCAEFDDRAAFLCAVTYFQAANKPSQMLHGAGIFSYRTGRFMG